MTAPTSTYPVQLELTLPERYEPVQLVLRLLVCAAIGLLHLSFGGLFGVLYLLLPTAAAVLISHRESGGFLVRDAGWLSNLLEWVVGFYAYMLLLTDRFPLEAGTRHVRLQIATGGRPSLGDALFRLLTDLPHALLLALLGIVASLLAVVTAVFVLLSSHVPEGVRNFQADYVAWLGRFLAYHASLVDVYPPFAWSGAGRSLAHHGPEQP